MAIITIGIIIFALIFSFSCPFLSASIYSQPVLKKQGTSNISYSSNLLSTLQPSAQTSENIQSNTTSSLATAQLIKQITLRISDFHNISVATKTSPFNSKSLTLFPSITKVQRSALTEKTLFQGKADPFSQVTGIPSSRNENSKYILTHTLSTFVKDREAKTHTKENHTPTPSTSDEDKKPITFIKRKNTPTPSTYVKNKNPVTFIKGKNTPTPSTYVKNKKPITFIKGKNTPTPSTYVKNKKPITFIKGKNTPTPSTYVKNKKPITFIKGKNTPTPSTYVKNKKPITYIKDILTTKSPTKTKEKYDKIEDISIAPPKCTADKSCKDRCGFKRQFGDQWSCFCDPDCDKLFKDCCEDFDEYCNASVMQEHVKVDEFEKRRNCIRPYYEESSIWMIGQCKSDWKDVEVLRQCTEQNITLKMISQLIPVIDQHNNTFLNRYCAICNDIKSFSQWEFEVHCDVKPHKGYTEAQLSKFMDFFCYKELLTLKQTWGKRHCVDIKSNCSLWNNDEAVESCLFGPTGVISDLENNHYRNWDCFICNSFMYDSYSRLACGPSPMLSQPPPYFEAPPFSSIFRVIPSSTTRCPQDQIYHKTLNECKKVISRNDLNFGNVLNRYAVTLKYKQYSNSCDVYLSSRTDNESTLMRFNNIFQKLFEITVIERDSKFTNLKIKPISNSSYRVIFEILENAQENELVESNIGLKLKLQNIEIHSNSRNFSGPTRLCTYSLNSTIVHKMSCSGNETISLNEVEIYKNKSAFVRKTKQSYNPNEYFVFKNKKFLALCKDYWPEKCSHYNEERSGSDWSLFENRSVHIYKRKLSLLLNFGEYTIVDGVLRFCYSNVVSRSAASIHQTILSYGTRVVLSISIVSLVLLLIVYSVFPPLRNLPGKNLMLFSTTLTLSQALWLLQRYITSFSFTLCITTAFALQYFLLASFSCSTSIAFHSLLTFLKISKGNFTQSSGKKFLYYVLFSLGFPLLLLLITWILYYHNILTIVHNQHLCWFKHDYSIYVAFYIPALTMLLLNVILLSKTIVFIRDCTKERRNLAEKSGAPTRMQIGIYLRMSSIMGATWLFGVFIVIFPDVVAFEYLFVIINGLQGFYVAVAFLLTDNVKKLFKRKRKGTTTSRSTVQTTR